MRYAELKPELPVLSFPRSREKVNSDSTERPRMNISRPRSNDLFRLQARPLYQTEIFDGDDLDLDDFLVAGKL